MTRLTPEEIKQLEQFGARNGEFINLSECMFCGANKRHPQHDSLCIRELVTKVLDILKEQIAREEMEPCDCEIYQTCDKCRSGKITNA